MQNSEFYLLFGLALFLTFEMLKTFKDLGKQKMLPYAVYDKLFLFGFITLLMLWPDYFSRFWWAILLAGIPSIYFNYFKIKNSKTNKLIQITQLVLILLFAALILIKVI